MPHLFGTVSAVALRGKYDRKRVRSKRVLSNGPHSLGSDTNQNRY